MPEPMTDEQRLAEFQTKINGFKPEGIDDDAWGKVVTSMVDFHKNEVQGLKVTVADLKNEKTKVISERDALASEKNGFVTKIADYEKKLASNQPDELRQTYENQQKQAKEIFDQKEKAYQDQITSLSGQVKTLEAGVLERDVMSAFNKAAEGKNWMGGARDMAMTMVIGKGGSNFHRLDMGDGTTMLVNENKQDISQALNQFLDTEFGKSMLKSGQSGGGADGTTTNISTGAKKISRADYNQLSPKDQMNRVLEGFQIIG